MNEKESILIVDDDEGTCRSLSLILRRNGYEVESVGTGRGALEKARGRFFNVVILDIRLPDIEGIDVLAVLKETHPDMAVIMATGHASLETAIQALNKGASAYVTKPLDMERVLAAVTDALGRQRLTIENTRLQEELRRELEQRTQAEGELRSQKEFTDSILNAMGDTFFVFDPENGTAKRWNPAYGAISGYSDEEIAGLKAPDSYYDEEDLKKAAAASEEVFREGMARVEMSLITRGGRRVPFDYLGVLVKSPEGKSWICAIGRDISERQRAQVEIAQNAKRLEALHGVAQVVSQTLDVEKVTASAVDKVVEVTGVDTCGIYLLDVANMTISVKAQRGMSEEFVESMSTIALDEHELQRLLQWRGLDTPLSRLGSQANARHITGALRREQLRSLAVVPMSVRGELVGVLGVGTRPKREFSAYEIELLQAIGNEIAVAIENAKLLEKTRALSSTDELTMLYNRRHFYEVLENEMHRARRYGHSFSLAMLDIDGFKEYNDRFGHTMGDSLLRAFAEMLRLGLRKSDLPFRYGGDEFTVVFSATEAPTARKVLSRIGSRWSRLAKTERSAKDPRLWFSAGISQFAEDAQSADGLVFLADTALFRSKREGGGKFTLASELGRASMEVLDRTTLDHIYALAATVDAKDPTTYGHSKRVAKIVQIIGTQMGLSDDELASLDAGALLHDIGKVGVPDTILAKRGRPAEREWKLIRQHSAEGARIVGHVAELASLVPIIRHHHEWHDGTGYPDGLAGEQIPLGARIISVADAYDTMTTPRQYRDVLSSEEACDELRRCAGIQFDPKVVEVFHQAMGESK